MVNQNRTEKGKEELEEQTKHIQIKENESFHTNYSTIDSKQYKQATTQQQKKKL